MRTLLCSLFFGISALTWAGVPPKQSPVPAQAPTLDIGKQKQEAERDYRLGVECADLASALQDKSKAAEYYRKAAAWYRRAADQGDPQAQNNLGVLYATGSGVPQSDAQAVEWYRLAAQQNDSQGQTNLAAMYQQGRGVPQDFAHAFTLVQKAAESGNPVAQNNLALMYANGQGTARSYVWAYAWLHVAAAEVSSAAQLRDRIGQKMQPAEIAKAKQLAAQKLKQLNTNQTGVKP